MLLGGGLTLLPSQATQTAMAEPYIRLARKDELDSMVELERMAFINDPVFNYVGNVQNLLSNRVNNAGRRSLQNFMRFLTKAAWMRGGLIYVVAVPQISGEAEKIAALAIWLPPRVTLELWHIWTLLRSGVITVLRDWGTGILYRLGYDYVDRCHDAAREAFNAKGIGMSSAEVWYLQLACTHPDHQGKGYLSKLIRNAYKEHPADIFACEATTAKSRDRYLHLGFELIKEVRVGKGKVNPQGLPTSVEGEQTGVAVYSVINWQPSA